MLETKSTMIQKEATETIGDVLYNLDYIVVNGVLTQANCKISKQIASKVQTPEGEQIVTDFQNIGNISLANSTLESKIKGSETSSVYMTQFEAYLKEITPVVETK
jgi:hypothetical protein